MFLKYCTYSHSQDAFDSHFSNRFFPESLRRSIDSGIGAGARQGSSSSGAWHSVWIMDVFDG